jgi:hypothetical protein
MWSPFHKTDTQKKGNVNFRLAGGAGGQVAVAHCLGLFPLTPPFVCTSDWYLYGLDFPVEIFSANSVQNRHW